MLTTENVTSRFPSCGSRRRNLQLFQVRIVHRSSGHSNSQTDNDSGTCRTSSSRNRRNMLLPLHGMFRASSIPRIIASFIPESIILM